MRNPLGRVLAAVGAPFLGAVLGYGLGMLGCAALGADGTAGVLVPAFFTAPAGALLGIFSGLWVALRET